MNHTPASPLSSRAVRSRSSTTISIIIGLPLFLAVVAAVAGVAQVRIPAASSLAGPPGLLAAVVGALAGMLVAGAGTAGLLFLRAYTRLLERRAAGSSPAGLQTLLRVLMESFLLGLGALVAGLFLVAFVRMMAQDSPQGVMFPVLSTVVILDGRALLLAFVATAATALVWGAMPILRATLRSFHPAGPRRPAATVPNGRSWVAGAVALVPVAVACALIAGTSLGVHSVLRVVLVERNVEVERAMVDQGSGDPAVPAPNRTPAGPALHSGVDREAPRPPATSWIPKTAVGRFDGWLGQDEVPSAS